MDNHSLILGIFILVMGSYAFRLSGPYLRQHFPNIAEFESLSNELTLILLFSLAITAALFEAGEFSGIARICSFLLAAYLAYKRVPLLIIVILASTTAALLRLLGMS